MYVFRLFLWYVEISKIMTLSIIIIIIVAMIIIVDTNNNNRYE